MSKHDVLLLKVRSEIETIKGVLCASEVYMRLEKTNRKVGVSFPLPKIDSNIPTFQMLARKYLHVFNENDSTDLPVSLF